MEKSRIILIVIGIAGMVAAIIFFVFLAKRPVAENTDNQVGGLPPASQPSYPNQPPSSPGAATTPSYLGTGPGAEAQTGVPTNAFAPPAPQGSSAGDFSGNAFQQPLTLGISGSGGVALSQLGSQLNLRDQNGNLLSAQQLLAQANSLPPQLQKLLNKPGGPTMADILNAEQQLRAQSDAIQQQISQFHASNQSQFSASSTEQCNKIISDAKNFVSMWGTGAVSSTFGQTPGCLSQLPLGFPPL